MASQHIEIPSTASRLSVDIRRAIDNLRDLQELIIKIKDISDQVASGADWAAYAVKLGTNSADAETAYNLITAVVDDLQTTDINAVLDRLG